MLRCGRSGGLFRVRRLALGIFCYRQVIAVCSVKLTVPVDRGALWSSSVDFKVTDDVSSSFQIAFTRLHNTTQASVQVR